MLAPLTDVDMINERLDAVTELAEHQDYLE
jgi:DNA mismatch repair ATPase MutS